MRLTVAILMLFLGVGAMAGETSSGEKVSAKHRKAWEKLGDQFLDQFYRFHPTGATADGLHQHDAELEDYSKAGVEAEVAALKQMRAQMEKFGEQGLDAEAQIDRHLVLGYLNNRLLTLEELRGWEKNADNYQSGITNSVFVIMARNYAPQEVEMMVATAMLPAKRLQALLDEAHQLTAIFVASRKTAKGGNRKSAIANRQ